jgi:hypothetical protein
METHSVSVFLEIVVYSAQWVKLDAPSSRDRVKSPTFNEAI